MRFTFKNEPTAALNISPPALDQHQKIKDTVSGYALNHQGIFLSMKLRNNVTLYPVILHTWNDDGATFVTEHGFETFSYHEIAEIDMPFEESILSDEEWDQLFAILISESERLEQIHPQANPQYEKYLLQRGPLTICWSKDLSLSYYYPHGIHISGIFVPSLRHDVRSTAGPWQKYLQEDIPVWNEEIKIWNEEQRIIQQRQYELDLTQKVLDKKREIEEITTARLAFQAAEQELLAKS